MADTKTMILSVLNKSKDPLSTYEVAKRLGISWSTASLNCYKLKDDGKVAGECIPDKVGPNKTMMWRIVRKEEVRR